MGRACGGRLGRDVGRRGEHKCVTGVFAHIVCIPTHSRPDARHGGCGPAEQVVVHGSGLSDEWAPGQP